MLSSKNPVRACTDSSLDMANASVRRRLSFARYAMFSQIITSGSVESGGGGAPRGQATLQRRSKKRSNRTKAQYSEMQTTYLPKKKFDGFVAE